MDFPRKLSEKRKSDFHLKQINFDNQLTTNVFFESFYLSESIFDIDESEKPELFRDYRPTIVHSFSRFMRAKIFLLI